MKNVWFLLLCACSIALAEAGGHSPSRSERRFNPGQKESLGFVSEKHQTLSPSGKNNRVALQLEWGSVHQGTRPRRKAMWLYRGAKVKPSGQLSLFAGEAGYAKTFAEAREVCNQMIPFGEWRMASTEHVMAFFKELLPHFTISTEAHLEGAMFWAASSSEKEDNENKDTFFTTKSDGKAELEPLSYNQFLVQVRAAEAKASETDEKKYYGRLLKFIEPGIPVICITGNEPEVRKGKRK